MAEYKITKTIEYLKALLSAKRYPGRQMRIIDAVDTLDQRWKEYLEAGTDSPSTPGQEAN
jgi:hypothetical protein